MHSLSGRYPIISHLLINNDIIAIKGTYSTELGAKECLLSPAGFYTASVIEATEISTCAAGRYSLSGSSECIACSSGRYSRLAASAECLSVPAGFIAGSSSEAVSYSECPAGRFSPSEAVECDACPPGTWSGAVASTGCVVSPPGRYTNREIAATGLIDCPAGTFSNESSAKSIFDCKACPIGFFNNANRSLSCNIVPGGCFSNQITGSNGYKLCPMGSFSNPGSISCTLCPAGKFSLTVGAAYDSICISCPEGFFSKLGYTACITSPVGFIPNKPFEATGIIALLPETSFEESDIVEVNQFPLNDSKKNASVDYEINHFSELYRFLICITYLLLLIIIASIMGKYLTLDNIETEEKLLNTSQESTVSNTNTISTGLESTDISLTAIYENKDDKDLVDNIFDDDKTQQLVKTCSMATPISISEKRNSHRLSGSYSVTGSVLSNSTSMMKSHAVNYSNNQRIFKITDEITEIEFQSPKYEVESNDTTVQDVDNQTILMINQPNENVYIDSQSVTFVANGNLETQLRSISTDNFTFVSNYPHDWEEIFSPTYNQKYWSNKLTGECTWIKPNIPSAEIVVEILSKSNNFIETNEIPIVFSNIEKSIPDEVSEPNTIWIEKFSEKYQQKYWKNSLTNRNTWKYPFDKIAFGDSTSQNKSNLSSQSSSSTAYSKHTADTWSEYYNDRYKRPYWKNGNSGDATSKESNQKSKIIIKKSKDPPSTYSGINGTLIEERTHPTYSSKQIPHIFNSDLHYLSITSPRCSSMKALNSPIGFTPSSELPSPIKSNFAVCASNDDHKSFENYNGEMSGDWIEMYSEKYQRKYWKNKASSLKTWRNPLK